MTHEGPDFARLLSPPPFRWPKKGDTLFQPSTEWMGDAIIEQHRHSRFVLMTSGYRKGADILVQQATDDRATRDFLVYPVIFCYRHFLELSLKYIIATYGPALGIGATWSGHQLTPLWKKMETLLAAAGLEQDEAHEALAICVAEFDKLDEGSFNFRYPTNTNGVTVPLDLKRVDLLQLRDVMDGIAHYFDGTDGYLSQYDY